jgi:type II secretory pathway predicted ATPase ExeA
MTNLPWGLSERPFPSAPLAAAYYPAPSLELSRTQLQRCIQRAEGLGVVIGGAGMGKSLLLHVLGQQFREQFHVAHLAGGALCTRRALLQNILFELGLPYRSLQEGELRLSLIDHLQPSRQCPHGMLLLIDEAHTLPLRLLEELRLLTNLVREGLPRVRLVLAGARSLEERLANPKLDSLQQRIAVRAYLQSWTSQDTAAYIEQELARCGGDVEDIFAKDALSAVHVAAAGIPRLINQVCDHALMLADGDGPLDAAAIQQAWADLQQLPAPWHEPAATAGTSSVEFGILDELTEERSHEDDPLIIDSVEAEVVADHEVGALVEVPSASALFGTEFNDEELVIDRYAALDVRALGDRPRVVTPLGQAFAQEVRIVEDDAIRPALKLVDAEEEASDRIRRTIPASGPLAAHVALARSKAAEEHVEPVETLAFDPVYPEDEAAADDSSARIVAIDQGHGDSAGSSIKPPVGNRFRNLFANLRGRKP